MTFSLIRKLYKDTMQGGTKEVFTLRRPNNPYKHMLEYQRSKKSASKIANGSSLWLGPLSRSYRSVINTDQKDNHRQFEHD